MAIANKILPHYTYDDWVHWQGRWELLGGHPIAMSPMPTPEHQRIAAELRTEFVLALRNSGCDTCRAYDPIDYVIANDTIVQPDILIVCGNIEKNFLDFPPVLVVEVLSSSTALRDIHTKFSLYEAEGVKYYLIVNADKKTIEIQKLVDGKYQLQSGTPEFELEEGCVINPDFSSIFD